MAVGDILPLNYISCLFILHRRLSGTSWSSTREPPASGRWSGESEPLYPADIFTFSEVMRCSFLWYKTSVTLLRLLNDNNTFCRVIVQHGFWEKRSDQVLLMMTLPAAFCQWNLFPLFKPLAGLSTSVLLPISRFYTCKLWEFVTSLHSPLIIIGRALISSGCHDNG